MRLLKNTRTLWVYIISIIFIALNSFLIAKEFYLFSLLPFALLILMLSFFALDKLLLMIVFLVPLSVSLSEFTTKLPIDMNLPTEPMLFGIMLLFIFKLLIERNFDKRVLSHPVSIAIYINLFWILFTTITSTLPLVSIKFLVSRLWFVIAFYFLATQLFRNFKYVKRYIWVYIIGFIIVIGYTITRHAGYGLINQKAAHFVMTPFLNDHTSYGAILAMLIPVILGFALKSNYSTNTKLVIWCVLALFGLAIVLSYTRAAWVSLVGAFAVWSMVKLRINYKYLLSGAAILLLLFFSYQSQIFIALEQNRQDSSTDLSEHVKSISNISSDASNLERINRWKSAIRMFNDKPVLGFGPGTYMFNYASYQFSYDKTIISTNAGDMGNAHSEYIGPLAESGVLGCLTLLGIIVATIATALRVYSRAKDKEVKMLSLALLLGLITYYLHGLLNNFLDTDKASVLFWGFTGIIVAFDVYYREPSTEKKIG